MRSIFLTMVLAAFFASSLTEKVRFDNYKVYRLTPRDDRALEVLKFIKNNTVLSGYDFWSPVFKANMPVDLMVPPYHIDEFEKSIQDINMDKEVLMEDVQKNIDKESARNLTLASLRTPGWLDWTGYQTLDEIYEWIHAVVRDFPQVATLINAGQTYQGRDILGVKLSFHQGNEHRSVFVESNIHAREWITASVSTYILNQFLTSQDAAIRRVADSHDWYFVPVANPDGFVHTHTSNRMWRKTRVPYNVLCYGADPNRNWGYKWMQGGADSWACSDTYGGPEPFSEPCVRNLANYIATIGTKLTAYISFHSYSQMLLLPYGYTTEPKDNYEELMEIGTKAMDVLSQRYGTQYVTGNIAETIYVATGGSMDWVKATFGTPLTYTYELRDRGQNGFILPPEQIIPSGLETLDSIISMFNDFDQRHPNSK